MPINSFSRTYCYVYFHATVADLSGCLRNQMAHKSKIFTAWFFTEVLTPDVTHVVHIFA